MACPPLIRAKLPASLNSRYLHCEKQGKQGANNYPNATAATGYIVVGIGKNGVTVVAVG